MFAATAFGGFEAPPGQQVWTSSGTWVCPDGVTLVHAVCVATASGVDGGALSWKNNIPVVPGTTYTVSVGEDSYFVSNATVRAYGKATRVGDGGGNGGTGTTWIDGFNFYGGAGGYTGDGGSSSNNAISAGSGGGGGGGALAFDGETILANGGGGGVGLLGEGTSGAAGQNQDGGTTLITGKGGSGGADGSADGSGGAYGGGGSTSYPSTPGPGAVRIIWGGGRSFPSNAADV